MAKKVKCSMCGKMFERGTYNYMVGKKYVCPGCAEAHNKEVRKKKAEISRQIRTTKRQERLAKTGMKQTYPLMALKLILAVVYLGICVFAVMKGAKPTVIVYSAFIALAFGLWALIPFFRRNKVKEQYKDAVPENTET